MGVHSGPRTRTDETALIGRARAGDLDAQDVLVRRYLADVYGLAFRMLRDEDLAQDAAQDAMVNAMRAIGRFRGDASFRTWVLRIAMNSAKSLARRRGRKREVPLTAVEGIAGDADDPAARAELKDEAERIRTQISRLPPKQGMAVELRVNQGLDYQDIARILKCSTGAARVNYHLGIKRLRELMR